ncbi:hypothetical protein [Candidatus Nitrosotenuis sp. DW1]|uniref:hypothetical protein n=1 Tax=Candidatus Nitrosotenuis sp. DW1 TaxID=2259672 RepID=UPI002101DCF1|nr:hypothetical protein [Candidatus Nitrosotenuis sp. DW1]
MSDTRFTMIGIALVFAGFLIFGIFGHAYYNAAIQAEEFEDCYEFSDDGKQIKIDCNTILQNRILFFGLVIGVIGLGIFFLIKGVRGKWDQDVKPEDSVGPGTSYPS